MGGEAVMSDVLGTLNRLAHPQEAARADFVAWSIREYDMRTEASRRNIVSEPCDCGARRCEENRAVWWLLAEAKRWRVYYETVLRSYGLMRGSQETDGPKDPPDNSSLEFGTGFRKRNRAPHRSARADG